MKYGQNNLKKNVKMHETIFLAKFHGHVYIFLKIILYYKMKEKEGTRKK